MEPVKTVTVRHNIETAHRLSQLPGRCENIHGHSMWVELELTGRVNHHGILAGLDFGAIKQSFRGHLDSTYDHRLLLNEHDELTALELPGLKVCPADPTTENIARWVGEWGVRLFDYPEVDAVAVRVAETHVNAASWRWAR
jgi:6-pyruvoyltetrahydropterin/6-carboxytetrahydropterin synthase